MEEKRKNGLPVIINASKTIAIAVKSGDENTGSSDAELTPKTKRKVGGAAAAVIIQNQKQLRLALKYSTPQAEKKHSACVTWFLLHHRRGDSVLAELSLPEWLGHGDRVEEWTERIILGVIPLGPQGILPSDPNGGSPNGDGGEEMPVAIQVSRR